MAEGRLTVGSVDVLALTDGGGDFPFPLSQLFPGVAAEAWEPYRQRYPELFGGPDTWRNHYGCYLLRSGAYHPGGHGDRQQGHQSWDGQHACRWRGWALDDGIAGSGRAS